MELEFFVCLSHCRIEIVLTNLKRRINNVRHVTSEIKLPHTLIELLYRNVVLYEWSNLDTKNI